MGQVFNPSEVFRNLYRQSCILGIHDYATSRQLDGDLICADIEAQIISMFSHMKYGGQSAVALRQRSLGRNTQYWSLLKPATTCLVCLQRNLEHYLECDHGICDVCVAILGVPTKGSEYYYDLDTCPLCLRGISFQARLLPPTCRVRFVGFDGGGSRGIVELGFMEKLRQALDLPYPVQEHFDYAIGTSSGEKRLQTLALED
jgi:hypothetical protein